MKTLNKVIIALAAGSALFVAPAFAADAPTAAPINGGAVLSLKVDNIAAHKGVINAGLFANKEGYDSGKGIKGGRADVTAGEIVINIEGIAPGEYAIKLYHDVNGDGEMNSNLFGMPTEPFAFSNNAAGSFGPAKWADAKFTIKAGDNTHTITFN